MTDPRCRGDALESVARRQRGLLRVWSMFDVVLRQDDATARALDDPSGGQPFYAPPPGARFDTADVVLSLHRDRHGVPTIELYRRPDEGDPVLLSWATTRRAAGSAQTTGCVVVGDAGSDIAWLPEVPPAVVEAMAQLLEGDGDV